MDLIDEFTSHLLQDLVTKFLTCGFKVDRYKLDSIYLSSINAQKYSCHFAWSLNRTLKGSRLVIYSDSDYCLLDAPISLLLQQETCKEHYIRYTDRFVSDVIRRISLELGSETDSNEWLDTMLHTQTSAKTVT